VFSRDFQRDAFLLDSAYPGGGRVSQHLVYILFGRRERWELPPPRAKDGLAFLVGPRSELFIGLICRVVHEHAVYIDSCHSQVIDDRQSGCVDVAPVDDVTALPDPWNERQGSRCLCAFSFNGYSARNWREVDCGVFVFEDYDGLRLIRRLGVVTDGDAFVPSAAVRVMARVKVSEVHTSRAAGQAEALAAGQGLDERLVLVEPLSVEPWQRDLPRSQACGGVHCEPPGRVKQQLKVYV
jgi:hypothetical protein